MVLGKITEFLTTAPRLIVTSRKIIQFSTFPSILHPFAIKEFETSACFL